MEALQLNTNIPLTEKHPTNFFRALTVVALIALLSTSVFSQDTNTKTDQKTTVVELVNQKTKLSEKLADLLLNGGGSTAEISYADEIDTLRK
ncbi:MAG: hypothetical protein LW628_06730, partial [Fimbriimonadaceae bacterium]|nr:hypothetical protein [Fimbriimonadaceae bacterium]